MENRTIKILVADDDVDTLELIHYNLLKEGYSVDICQDGAEAYQLAVENNYDLVILDIMMPKMDGMEVCIKLREEAAVRNTLIAFLTARSEEYSQIAGYDAGSDDYIIKPIKPHLFLARIKALLRRKIKQEKNTIYVGDLRIDTEKFEVFKENTLISLAKKEFKLLALLAGKPGKVFTRQEILKEVWGSEQSFGARTIDVHIKKIRDKIGDNYIKSIIGVGYKIEEV